MLQFTRPTVAALGIGVGLACFPSVTKSEQLQVPEASWLGWLVRTSPHLDKSPQESDLVCGLQQAPGKVFVWGGKFGKSPRQIHGLGDTSVVVAAGDGVGAALDEAGNLLGFQMRNGSELVSEIEVPGRPIDVAIRSAANELVLLNSAGHVAVSKCKHDGTFEPAKLLKGIIQRHKVAKVRCGPKHCVAITKHGNAFSWGSTDSHGQLASDVSQAATLETADVQIPKPVQLPEGTRIRDAACGGQHTLFVDEGGVLFGVGDDQWAQLGISAEPWLKSHEKASPVLRKSELLAGLAIHSIAGGGQHSVMLVRDGTVFSFGFNQWGQLGHHNYSSLAPPSPIADFSVRAIAILAGENHTCLVKDTGELYCIGGNDKGQLGAGNLQPSAVWKKVRFRKKALRPSYIHSSGNTCAVIVPVSRLPESPSA